MLRAHILLHEQFETIGNIAAWLAARGAQVSETHLYQPASRLPAPDSFDLLVVMGGTMSVNDEPTLPWLRTEKHFLRDVIARGTPTLGICLGSQLLASALGAPVYGAPHAEFGWLEVESLPVASNAFQFPARFSTFQSHGETFDLPKGAIHLARSAACEHQAFQYGERTIAIQFHLESTRDSAEAITGECAGVFSGPHAQTPETIRAATDAVIDDGANLMGRVLDYLTRNIKP